MEILRKFNSILEFYEAFKQSYKEHAKGRGRGNNCPRELDFYKERLLFGNKTNLKPFKKAWFNDKNLNESNENTKRIKNNFYGASPNVARYCLNLPKTMKKREQVKLKQKNINVFFDPCTPWRISDTARTEKFSEILQVIAGFEKQGYRVKLSIFIPIFDNRYNCTEITLITVKTADTLINIKKLTHIIGDSSFLREEFFEYTKEDMNRSRAFSSFMNFDRKKALEWLNNTMSELSEDNSRCLYFNYVTDLSVFKRR